MKTTTLVLLMILVALPMALADSPNLQVTLLSYTPVPAEPGSYATLTIKVLNNGDEPATNAAIEFIDNFPFSVQDDPSRTVMIGNLPAHEYYLAEYRVRIDSEALDGTNYIKLRYIPNVQQSNWLEKELAFTVSSTQKTITINNVEITPDVVNPGEQADTHLKIKNLAKNNLRDVSVKLELGKRVIGTEVIDLPFAPIGSSVQRQIALLKSGETADFHFLLQTYPEAESGVYKVPVTLTYTDESGTDYSREDLITLVIDGDIDIMTQIESTTLYSDQGTGDIIFSITNKGLSQIKFLTFVLEESPNYQVRSTSNAMYLGNIDSDDYETADFSVKLTGNEIGSVSFPVTLTFKDSLNNEHTLREELTLPLITTKEAGKTTSKTGIITVVLVIIALVGFFIWRKRKKKS